MPEKENSWAIDSVGAAIAHLGLDVAEIVAPAESYSSTVRLITLTSGERLVLKIPYTRVKLHRELTALRTLGADLPVPAVIDAWIPETEDPGALLLAWLPGTGLDPAVEGASLLDLVGQMGALLATLHAHRLPAYGEVHDPRTGVSRTGESRTGVSRTGESPAWWDIMNQRFQLWIRTCAGTVPARRLAEIEDLFSILSTNLPAPDGPCWVHADFRPANVLVRDGRITGLIDFESARGGSADLDFVKVSHALFDVVPGSQEAFLAGYDSVRLHPDLDRTLPYYRLHNAVGGLAWCIRRTDPSDPFYRENNEVVEAMLRAYR